MAKEKKVLPFSPDDKISLVFAKNQGYYKFPGGDINSDKAYIYGLLDSYESVQETAVLLIKHYELNIVNFSTLSSNSSLYLNYGREGYNRKKS